TTGHEAVIDISASGLAVDSLRVRRVFGDDIDDAVDRIGSPQRRAGTTDDLDAVEIGEKDVLHIPQRSAEERIVDCAPIDQYERLVGKAAGEAAHPDRPGVRVRVADEHAWRHAKNFRQSTV